MVRERSVCSQSQIAQACRMTSEGFRSIEWAKARPVQHSKRTGSKHVVGGQRLFCGHWGATTVFKQGSDRTRSSTPAKLNWQNIQQLTAERATWLFYHWAPLHPHQTWLCSRSAPLLSSPPPQPALTIVWWPTGKEHHTGRVCDPRSNRAAVEAEPKSSFPAHQQGSQGFSEPVLLNSAFPLTSHVVGSQPWGRKREKFHQLLNVSPKGDIGSAQLHCLQQDTGGLETLGDDSFHMSKEELESLVSSITRSVSLQCPGINYYILGEKKMPSFFAIR